MIVIIIIIIIIVIIIIIIIIIIVDWTKEELQEMDREDQKLLTINRVLHPQADIDRLYLKRSEGGRGMIGVEDCVTIETNSLMSYIKQHANEKALKAGSSRAGSESKEGRDG